MARFDLTDFEWSVIQHCCRGDVIVAGLDLGTVDAPALWRTSDSGHKRSYGRRASRSQCFRADGQPDNPDQRKRFPRRVWSLIATL